MFCAYSFRIRIKFPRKDTCRKGGKQYQIKSTKSQHFVWHALPWFHSRRTDCHLIETFEHLCIVCLPNFCLRILAFSLWNIYPFVTVVYLNFLSWCEVLLWVFSLFNFRLFRIVWLLFLCFMCGYTFFHSIPPECLVGFIAFGSIDTLSCVLFGLFHRRDAVFAFGIYRLSPANSTVYQHFIIFLNSIFVLLFIQDYSSVVDTVGPTYIPHLHVLIK